MGFDLLGWISATLSRPTARGVQDRPARRRVESGFHAVSINPGVPCCEAASRFRATRFLSGDAPKLPLPDCDQASCSCRFAHHADRRSGVDRRAVYDLDHERQIDFKNRRRSNGRRSTDPVSWGGTRLS